MRQYYKVDQHWRKALRDRELTLAKAHEDIVARRGTQRNLPPLQLGTKVRVQNQATREWDRTGIVTETLAYRQYTIRLDGSDHLSCHNRVHLRPVLIPTPSTPAHHPDQLVPVETRNTASPRNTVHRSTIVSQKHDFYCG